MISSEICVKVTFDEKGRKKIENAVRTIREVIDALEKAGGGVEFVIDSLNEGESYLLEILDGIAW